jgi:hypothetical protein
LSRVNIIIAKIRQLCSPHPIFSLTKIIFSALPACPPSAGKPAGRSQKARAGFVSLSLWERDVEINF